MRKLAIAAVMALSISPAMADVCTDHGFRPGTMEYLECWRYVNHQEDLRHDYLTGWGREARGWADSTSNATPMVPWQTYEPNTGLCRNQWGQQVVCRP